MADYAQIVQQGNATGLALPSESAALVFTSPPYNTGIENRVGLPVYSHDVMPWRDYEDMAQAAAIEMDRILIQGGRVALNVQPAVPFSPIDKDDRRRVNLQQIWTEALEDAGLQYRDTIAWIQDSHDGACAWGSWARPTAPNFRGGWEVILIYFKAGTADKEGWRRDPNPKWADYKEERFGPGGDLTDCYRNVWKLRPARSDLKATFPVELPLRAIRTMTYPDDMVAQMASFGLFGATIWAASM